MEKSKSRDKKIIQEKKEAEFDMAEYVNKEEIVDWEDYGTIFILTMKDGKRVPIDHRMFQHMMEGEEAEE